MANRAYLFSADRSDAWDRPYRYFYDSRHTIPLSWFFFFRPDDLQMVDVHCGRSNWQEPKLSAEKRACLELFEARQPLLRSLIGDYPTREMIVKFVATVDSRAGRYLIMEPSEVLLGIGQDDEQDGEMFARILSSLDSGEERREPVRKATSLFVGELSPDPDTRERQVIGYTYCW